jgi:hypothetical protein
VAKIGFLKDGHGAAAGADAGATVGASAVTIGGAGVIVVTVTGFGCRFCCYGCCSAAIWALRGFRGFQAVVLPGFRRISGSFDYKAKGY